MPTYVYQVIEADGSDGEVFEILQKISDAPLSVHPVSGLPVRKLLAVPNTMRKFSPGNLSNDKLGSLGFTKYERSGGGTYEKKAGGGPDVISGN